MPDPRKPKKRGWFAQQLQSSTLTPPPAAAADATRVATRGLPQLPPVPTIGPQTSLYARPIEPMKQEGVHYVHGDVRDVLNPDDPESGVLDLVPGLGGLRAMIAGRETVKDGHPIAGAALGALGALDITGTIAGARALAKGPAKQVSKLLGAKGNTEVSDVGDRLLHDIPQMGRITEIPAERGRQMAKLYESLPVNDPNARGAYDALNEEVAKQYKAAQDAGFSFEFVDADPYKSSAEMMEDVRTNKRLKVFKTPQDNFHPYMTPEQNDMFRAVHDWIAHAGPGNQFGPVGEENAYRMHAATLSPRARQALATETRGQNSWVNFGPNSHLPPAQRPFAEQKAALWPDEFTGDYDAMPPELGPEKMVGRDEAGNVYTNRNRVQRPSAPPLPRPNTVPDTRVPAPAGSLARELPVYNAEGQYQPSAVVRQQPAPAALPGPARGPRSGMSDTSPSAQILGGDWQGMHRAAAGVPGATLREHTPGSGQSGFVARFGLDNGDDVSIAYGLEGPEKDELAVHFIGSMGAENSVGPRDIMNIRDQLLAKHPGVKRITGHRVSGARVAAAQRQGKMLTEDMAHADIPLPGPQVGLGPVRLGGGGPVTQGEMFAPHVNTTPAGGNVLPLDVSTNPAGVDASRPELSRPPRADLSVLDPVFRRVREVYTPAAERGLRDNPVGSAWYDMTPLREAMMDLSPTGEADFNMFMRLMGPTSAGTDVPQNMRQASMYYKLWKEGRLTPEALREKSLELPTGYKNRLNIRPGLIKVLEQGELDPFTTPKTYRYSNQLGGKSWGGVALDRHVGYNVGVKGQYAGGEGAANASKLGRGSPTGGYRTTNMIDTSPENTHYAAIEDAMVREAEKMGVHPAVYQAAGWVGNAEKTGVTDARHPIEILNEKFGSTAKKYGYSSPLDAFKAFVRGQTPLWSLGGLGLLDDDELYQ